ncbi:MAG: serine hydrolase domain-containing protein [Sphingomonadaceae bacterium]
MSDPNFLRALDEVLSRLAAARDKEGNPLNLHEIVVSNRTGMRSVPLNSSAIRVDLRSISKPVLGFLFGALLELPEAQRSGLTFEASVWPFFEKELVLENVGNLDKLRDLKVSHLLNSTLGHQDGIMFRKDIGDRPEETLLNYSFNYPLDHVPGTHFVYSNAGAFILSALISRVFERTADDLAREIIFAPLEIEQIYWRHFGSDCAGCTGLKLNASEMNQIGRAIVGGMPNEAVPLAWRISMLDSFYPTPTMVDEKRALPKRGYGHFLWKSRDGHCYTDGTDGQYLIICGDRDTVISVTGQQPDMKPIGEALRPLLENATQH